MAVLLNILSYFSQIGIKAIVALNKCDLYPDPILLSKKYVMSLYFFY
jgi:hypothetical protein